MNFFKPIVIQNLTLEKEKVYLFIEPNYKFNVESLQIMRLK